jgi:hypothetical protein
MHRPFFSYDLNASRSGPQRRGHPECVHERDLRGEHGCESRAVGADAGDIGARDFEDEGVQGGARGREGQEPGEDCVSTELIGLELAFEEAGASWP